ncbi:MAG TPA: hypothetical protein VIY29_10940, partial [Ktedonobacteraceae bacterium]
SERILVRVIEYPLTAPARNGSREPHRIVTTWLDPHLAPALDLVDASHQRWEIETTIDEVDTHQRLVNHPGRAQKARGRDPGNLCSLDCSFSPAQFQAPGWRCRPGEILIASVFSRRDGWCKTPYLRLK